MIDLHCHVLPGIDDGPASLDGSVALAQAASADGISSIVATPHVSWRYRNDAGTIAAAVQALGQELRQREVSIDVVKGAEIALDRIGEMDPESLGGLTLGTGPWLLVEPPFSPVAPALEAIVFGLMHKGHNVVIAHPERCPAFHRDPQLLESLVRAGALTSITAASLNGRFGSPARRFGWWLLEKQLTHNIASDAHDTVDRPPSLAAEIARAGIADLAEWMTVLVPAAILAGESIPPAPPMLLRSGRRAKSLLRRLGRRGG